MKDEEHCEVLMLKNLTEPGFLSVVTTILCIFLTNHSWMKIVYLLLPFLPTYYRYNL